MAAWLAACLLAGWMADWLASLLARWLAGWLAGQPLAGWLGGSQGCLSPPPFAGKMKPKSNIFDFVKVSAIEKRVHIGVGMAKMTFKPGSLPT